MTSSPPQLGPKVPLVDLSRVDDELLVAAEEAFSRLARSGVFTFGEELAAFEREFAMYCGTRECVGVSDGTDALKIALEAVGVRPGDEVVTVPNTFVGTAEGIASAGARPVLVDVEPDTRCMDPGRLAEAIGPRTAAVLPVHLYGRPAPMREILDVCGRIPVVEDVAQAHGAEIDGRRVGGFGAAGCFSFYPTKNLGAMGDGGAVVCDDTDLASIVRSLRHHGSAADDPNLHVRRGSTARLDTIQAAVLRIKLPLLDRWNEQRRQAADRYRTALSGLDLTLPSPDAPGTRQVFHLFVIELDDRDSVLQRLRDAGIGASVHYPIPLHLQPAWRQLGYAAGSFPHAERSAGRCLSLPLFPGISDAEIDRVAATLSQVVGEL